MTANMRRFFYVAFLLGFCRCVDIDNTSTTPPSPGQSSPDADEVFTAQPLPISYTSAKKNAIIQCSAKDADGMHIKCNGEFFPEDKISKETITRPDGQRILVTEVEVPYIMVFEVFRDFYCICQALLEAGNRVVTSQKGLVKIASLKKNFPGFPLETSVEATKMAELLCIPPDGAPSPTVHWEKDGKIIDALTEMNYIVTSEGSLIINQATEADQGEYVCVATNDFFTRKTDAAELFVYTNGGWSTWTAWDSCDSECGSGLLRRSRTCTNPPPGGRDGRPCEGPEKQESPCTAQCPLVDGAWSRWGAWSICVNCRMERRRTCDNPLPQGGGYNCPGTDVDVANCTSAHCPYGPVADSNPNLASTKDPQNIILWVVLCAAVAVCAVILVIIVMCLMKKKGRRGTMYDTDSNDVGGSNTSDAEKFEAGEQGTPMLPDITKSTLPHHQTSFMTARIPSNNGSVEKKTMLNGTNRQPPIRDYYMQISPAIGNFDTHDYMQIGSHDSDSGDDKISQQSSSPESGICNSCDRQSLMSGQIASTIDVEALAWGNLSHKGGRLSVPESGINVIIPEGAISRNQTEEIFIAALRDDKDRPVLLDKQTLLSPVILCGPQSTTFNKSLILSFDHCASLKLGQWKLSIYSSNSAFDETPQWDRLLTLNQEILHAPIYCQLDSTRCHVMVDQLASRYCLVGESMYGSKAVKHLKLAAFAQPYSGNMDCNIRVYVLPDTQDALHNVVQQETKLGARLMDKPKQISFQDGGHNMCLMVDSLATGWASKLPAQYQEIPFRHVWNGQSNLHCSFAFERMPSQPASNLSCKIQVYQKSVLSNRQQINIFGTLESSAKIFGPKDLASTVTMNTQSSSGCSSIVTLDNRDHPIFKLPTPIKKKLATYLDIPCMRGNDWRMLASALSSDRQLNFFASKPSPTEAVLDLWEARSLVEEATVAELTNILRAMGRQDAASVLDRELANAWV